MLSLFVVTDLSSFRSPPASPPAAKSRITPVGYSTRPQSPRDRSADEPSTSHPGRRCMDVASLPSIVRSCDSLRQLKCVHAAALRSSLVPAGFLANNLITGYSGFGEITVARKVFDGLPNENVVTWTALLNGYLNLGLHDNFAQLFGEMAANGVAPNEQTFVCVLKSCGESSNFELGKQVHAGALKSGCCLNVIVDSAVVYMYVRCNDMDGALAAFTRMRSHDVVSWTTMVTAYVHHGRHREALELFSAMQQQGNISPNEFTVCSVLKACTEMSALRLGKQLHCTILKKMYLADVHIGSSLVTLYARCGDLSDARAVFDRMPRRNTVTWTSMICGYAHARQGEAAIVLFRRMKRRRMFVNALTIVGVLSACGCLGLSKLGREVHGQVIKNLLSTNLHVGSTLVSFYCKCGRYTEAARVLEAMPARDTVSWTALISGYAGFGHNAEALKQLSGMLSDGVSPNPFTYTSALKACARMEAVRCGQWVHSRVSKAAASAATVHVGSSLIDMYMRCGDVAGAEKVFEGMPERNAVTWKVMVIGLAINGHSRAAMSFLYRMRRDGHPVDDFLMTAVLNSCAGEEADLVTDSPALN